MFRNKKGSLVLCLAMALGTALVSRPARAANVALEGAIGTDDAVQLFNLTVANPGSVDIRSYGYAGGTTSTGTVVPSGGFDTILTLFSASGSFIDDNDDGAGVATDPRTGLAADARLTESLTPGNYIVALTQFDNFSISDLADGFAEQGNHNFTANSSFAAGGPCPGNMFRDISGSAGRCRNGNWTVDFVNVASVSAAASTPEPSALLLAGVGLALLLVSCGRRRKATLLAGGLVAALASVPVQAQTNCPAVTSGPDYCHVSDFLNGQRTLLQVTDLEIVTIDPGYGGAVFNQIQTSNSNQTAQNSFVVKPIPFTYQPKPVRQFSAHMFDQPSAVTISTLYYYNDSLFPLWIQNIAQVPSGGAVWTPLGQGDYPQVNCGAVADFTQDGYDDLALGFDDGRILVIGPKDPTDISKGFNDSLANLNSLQAMAAGDFNGDGRKELAGLTVIPNGQPGAGGLALVIYTVDPKSLAVTPAATLVLTTPGASPSTPITHASMSSGQFTTLNHDQLAVTFATDSGSPIAEIIDFASNTLTPKEGPALTVSTIPVPVGYLQVEAGKFGLPNNPYDQIVFHESSTSAGGKFFWILSADRNNLTLTSHNGVGYNQFACAASEGIQVGNFDHRQPDPSTPGQTDHNPNSQIAFLYCSAVNLPDNIQYSMNIYSVDPNTFNIGNPDSVAVNVFNTNAAVSFAATDVQGRSLMLGEPTKITIDSAISPTVVVGAPPMHVDFISPAPLSGAPAEVLNVSAVPDAFNTTYDQESSSETTTSTTNKTSWSFGAQESVNGSLTVGDPDAGEGLKVSDTLTAAQNLKGASEGTHGTFTQSDFTLSTTTGLGDQIVYTDSQFNIWVYPVIGKTVCPAATPNCQANQKVPLTIQFSAPNGDAKTITSPGANLPWYQPPWEPGNILSYPANAAQLRAVFPNLTSLTNGVTFASTSGAVTEHAVWSGQSHNSSTASFDQDYSFDNNFSVDGAVGFAGISAGGGYSLDLSGSYGLSSLSESSNQVASSTGLKIQVPGTVANFANYGYLVSPSIMGTMPGPDVVDSPPNTGDTSSVQTFGRLYAMYTVDPLNTSQGAGTWWRQAYTGNPDVALNHPKRWTFTPTSLVGEPPSNCLAIGAPSSQYDCVTLNAPTPNDPLGDDFHVMRGFFIAKSNSQNENFQNQGPQLEVAKSGDVLNLSARVYNYSLADMPGGTQVHARFYYMLWDTNNAKPVDPQGASTLISEVTMTGPISKFDTSSDQPNWTLLGTQFNTGDASHFPDIQGGNVSLVFWVVVWMQDSSGLVSELPNHGLPAIPGAFASWTAALNFECQSADNCYSSKADINPLSNNI
ncbi:MAG: VCBS repeat-containing protein, partial [Acidobacteriaceae bacterium]|nr:VCBS repeat-containing protein [Acidobacteriaceae bacterium]